MNISISRYCYFSDQQTKQSVKEAVFAQVKLNPEAAGNQNQEKDALNIPVSYNHDKVHLANVHFQ